MSDLLKHNQSQWQAFLTSQALKEVPAQIPQHYLCELSEWELLFVEGLDASTFLQGQTSCDIQQCKPGNALHGACVNIKGRVIANFIVINPKTGCYVLACPPGNGENLYKVLKKYSVFSKVNLHFESAELAFALSDNSKKINDLQTHSLKINEQSELQFLLDSKAKLEQLWLDQSNVEARFSSSLFSLLSINIGLVFVEQQSSELFTPQEINLDLTAGISFTKGCYTGQEVVARLHYRGVPKRRVYLGTLNAPVKENLLAMQVMDEAGKEQGHIVAHHKTECLISLNRKFFDEFQQGHSVLKLANHRDSIESLSAPGYSLD